MRSAIAFGVAALAGSALAAPQYGAANVVEDVHYVVETVVHTLYVTDQPGRPSPTTSCTTSSTPIPEPTPEAAYAPPVVTVVYPAYPPPAPTSQAPKPKPTPVYTPAPPPPPPAPTSATPTPTPTPSPSPAPAPSTGGYMDIVMEWRSKLGLGVLEYDEKLQSNALKTVTESNGQMIHELNPGTMGQVLAPGKPDIASFTSCFVGGWLCEMPNLAGLEGQCTKYSQGWNYEGQTGHAKILTDPSYKKIGCANAAGIWGCDLA
ncbi:CAP domain [Pyrenophora seminiperda CCB06]|uniref:CAP domain n=1 Tax=Pyrenophora seminiperda CCB06 TaxID=1302712 RepID=A0A3M7LY12_9PLEO|nr:CAP domain [Pyrenophora seminiperda CCB06]